jgi:hypothetical protein
MTALTCEQIIEGRAKNGRPSCCGRAAAPYRLIGGLASINTALCEKHALAIEQSSYRVERPDVVVPLNVAVHSAELPSAGGRGDDETDQLPLFGR